MNDYDYSTLIKGSAKKKKKELSLPSEKEAKKTYEEYVLDKRQNANRLYERETQNSLQKHMDNCSYCVFL